MNVVKFKDIPLDPTVLCDLPDGYLYKVQNTGTTEEPVYEWVESDPAFGRTPQEFCDYFNMYLRNRYAYAIHWNTIVAMNTGDETKEKPGDPYPVGNPFEDALQPTYVSMEKGAPTVGEQWNFNSMIQWMDRATTIKLLQNNRDKYLYLNEFTPDDDITIEELKVFRTWLAQILLANEPYIQERKDEDSLRMMLKYYAQNMKDDTVKALSFMAPYMEARSIVAGVNPGTLLGMSGIKLNSGCGCNGGGILYNGSSNTVCDPLSIYRNAIYNYMVEVFSDIHYWEAQTDICIEMKKYIEGILKVGLPLSTSVIDPFSDCTCSSVDTDAEARYRKMLESLIQALEYIINGEISGNKLFINKAFNDWAVYLYEYMYWA